MIVENMTQEEIILEYQKDKEKSLLPFIQHFIDSNKYRRYYLKHKKNNGDVKYPPISKRTPRGNEYLIFLSTTTKYGASKIKMISVTIALVYMRKDGFYVMVPSKWIYDTRREGFAFFSPHFFNRYRERCIKDLNVSKMDIIKNFLSDMNFEAFGSADSSKYPNSMFMNTKEGIILGYFDSERVIFNCRTFVASEMLHDNQLRFKDFLKELKDTHYREAI